MKRQLRLLRSVIGGLLLALIVVGIAYAATTVDTFDVGAQGLEVTEATQNDSGYVENGAILGGERDTFLAYSSGSGARINLDIDFLGTSDRLAYTAGDTLKGTAEIQWDGDDNGASSLNYGLNADLSSDDGFLVKLLFDDLEANLTMEAHTDATHWSDFTMSLPGSVDDDPSRMDLFFDQASFTSQGSGGGVNWSDVDAIVLKIDGTVDAGLDLTIDFVESTSVRDYGDLPSGYPSTVLNANHIPQTLRLGNNVDAEGTYQASNDAQGDDSTASGGFDDEDGVEPTPGVNWSVGTNGGSVRVTVEGCSGTCYLNGWIDWGNNNSFTDAGDQIFTDTVVSDGTSDRTFDIPSGTTGDTSFYARFRICDASGACDDADNTDTNVTNGEVEDYRWTFGPNVVTITEFTAEPRIPAVVLAGVALLGVAAVTLFALTRRRKA